MRLYQRDPEHPGIWQCEFSLPSGGPPMRKSTGERDKRLAWTKACALAEAATRQWSRQEDLFASRDSYYWEAAVEDWNRTRMKAGLALATINFDGQNERYLSGARDGEGKPFFAGRLVRDIDAAAIDGYTLQMQALGLLSETIAKRLGTLRQILAAARTRRGSDGRPLLGELPPIISPGRSRDPDGWGRALTVDEGERVVLAFPTSDVEAMRPGLSRRIFELAKAGPVTAEMVIAATGADPAYVRTALSRASNLDHPDHFLRRLREREQTGRRCQPLRRYALCRDVMPAPAVAAVDQRGWVEIALETGMHASDVNDFCPESFNLGPGRGGPPHRLHPGTFVWRNSKNRRRTRKVRDQVRRMSRNLTAVLERLTRLRGATPGVPIAGRWLSGNIHRDFQLAARRAGLEPVADDRGRPHLLSANDLRRTAATWLAEWLVQNGKGLDRSPTEIIADFLGHTGLDVARQIYDRAKGARLDIVTSVFDALHAARKGPRASGPMSDESDIAPAFLRERK